MEDASNQGRMIADLDRDTGVALMDDEGTEKKAEDAQVAGDKQVKGRQAEIYQIDIDHASKVLSMQEDEPEVQEAVEVVTTAKLITEIKEQLEEEENRVIESINETLAQKAAKRRKLNEEVKDLKQHLEIMPGEDDDVYTEATPLARKVPVVSYHIIQLNNKPRYKIIRADGTHQLNQMDKLESGRVRGLYIVKQGLRAGSCWNRVVYTL
nr:hypothetical protein [Tanacetum cinerariifolium]